MTPATQALQSRWSPQQVGVSLVRPDVVDLGGGLEAPDLLTLDTQQVSTQALGAPTPHGISPLRNAVPPAHVGIRPGLARFAGVRRAGLPMGAPGHRAGVGGRYWHRPG